MRAKIIDQKIYNSICYPRSMHESTMIKCVAHTLKNKGASHVCLFILNKYTNKQTNAHSANSRWSGCLQNYFFLEFMICFKGQKILKGLGYSKQINKNSSQILPWLLQQKSGFAFIFREKWEQGNFLFIFFWPVKVVLSRRVFSTWSHP